mgnify:CR=1 FL=1
MTLLQLAGVDKLLELGARAVNHQSLDDQRAAAKKGIRPHSVTTSRLSRTISDAHIIFPIHPLSPLVHAANRIEAADMVQTLYERMVEELHHSKAIVSHEVSHHYPSDVSNVDLLQKTHPIFYVNVLGDLVFLPISRTEYARYMFQQKRVGKFGLQPWLWRGYLEPPKAPEPWRKFAMQKLREWSERFKERGKVVKPALQPVPVSRVRSNRIVSAWSRMRRRAH